MANKNRLKAQVDDELRTLFVCPDALVEQQQQLFPKGRTMQMDC